MCFLTGRPDGSANWDLVNSPGSAIALTNAENSIRCLGSLVKGTSILSAWNTSGAQLYFLHWSDEDALKSEY